VEFHFVGTQFSLYTECFAGVNLICVASISAVQTATSSGMVLTHARCCVIVA